MSLSQQNTLKDALRNALAQGYFVAITKAIEQYPEAANFRLNNSIGENVLQAMIRKQRPEATVVAQHATLDSLLHTDQFGYCALALAIIYDQLSTVEVILKKAKSHLGQSFLTKMEPADNSLLSLAAENQQPKGIFIFKALLDAGISPDSAYPSESTAHILYRPNYLDFMIDKGWSLHGQHPQTKATWAAYLNKLTPEETRISIITHTTEEEWRTLATHTKNGIPMSALMYVLTQAQGQVAKEILGIAGPTVGAEQPNFHSNLALHYALQFAPQICRSIAHGEKIEKAMQWYGDFVLKPLSHYTGGSQILKFGKTLDDFAEEADRDLTKFFVLANKTPCSILSTATIHGEKMGKMDKLLAMAQEIAPQTVQKHARAKI